MDMHSYFNTIVPDIPPKHLKDEQDLDAIQQKAFRSQVMKLSCPVRHVLPQLACGISYLSSKMTAATVFDWRRLYVLQKEAMELVAKNEACIVFRKLDVNKLIVVTSLDASFAKEEGMKSLCGFISVVTEEKILRAYSM